MTYETVERYEASWLLSQGHRLVDTALKGNSKLVTFIFDDSNEDIEAQLLEFNNDIHLQRFIQGFEQANKLIRQEQDRSVAEQRRQYGS